MKYRWKGVNGEGTTLMEALYDEFNQYRGEQGWIARFVEWEVEFYWREALSGSYREDRFKTVCKDHIAPESPPGGPPVHVKRIDEDQCAWEFAQEQVEFLYGGGYLFDWFDQSNNDEVAECIMREESCPPVEEYFSEVYGTWMPMSEVVGKCSSCGEFLIKMDFMDHGGIGQCGRCGMPVPEGMEGLDDDF